MNGAAEAILEELLAQAKTQTQVLQRLARDFSGSAGGGGGGSGGGGSGGGSAAGLLSSFNPLSLAMKAASGAFSIISTVVGGAIKIFGTLASITLDITQKFADFGKQAVTAGVRLSDFYNVFSSLPLVGRLFTLASTIQQVNEAALDMYRSISTVGATFGGSVAAARDAATRAGLTFDEFAKVIKGNAEALAAYGGTTETGATALARMNRAFMTGTDQSGRSILGLGVKFDEAADYLAGYMGRLAMTGDQRNKSDEEVTAGAREYVFQLDRLARLTGEEREALDKKLRAQKEEEDFYAYLSTLSPQERANAEAMQAFVKAANPEGLEQFYAQIRGLDIPMGEYGKTMTQLGLGHHLASKQITDLMKSNLSREELDRQMMKLTYQAGKAARDAIGANSQVFYAAGIKINFGAASMARRFESAEAAAEGFNKSVSEGAAAATGSARAAAMQDLAARSAGQGMLGLAAMISGAFKPILDRVANGLMQLAQVVFPMIADKAEQFSIWFGKTIDEYIKLYKEGGLSALLRKMFYDMKEGLNKAWETIKDPVMRFVDGYLKPWFSNLMVEITRYLEDMVDKIMFGTDEEDKKARRLQADADKAANIAEGRRAAIESLTAQAAKEKRALTPEEQKSIAELNTEIKAKEAEIRRLFSEIKATGSSLDADSAVGTYIAQRNKDKSWARHSGTIGMTGSWWEKESGPINVQAGETVLTQGQLAQIVDTAGSNKLAVQVERLNNLTAQMLVYLKQTADNTAKTHRATSAMSGNAFVM